MSSLNEHVERWRTHQQPRRVDHTTPGFVRPPDPATGVNAGPPSDRDGADDAPDEAQGVSTPAPVAVSCSAADAAGHYAMFGTAECHCDPPHHPLTPADPHPHAWADLGTPGLHGSVCRLCGETQID